MDKEWRRWHWSLVCCQNLSTQAQVVRVSSGDVFTKLPRAPKFRCWLLGLCLDSELCCTPFAPIARRGLVFRLGQEDSLF